MKFMGFVLVVLGVLALVHGGISHNRQKTIIDVSPFKATATEQKNIPPSPIVGGIAQIGSSATLGTGTAVRGNLVALSSITLNSGATLSGRARARNGAATPDSNAITMR